MIAIRGIGKILPSSVDGPGERAVVHFAGCSVGCAGCFNPHTHAFVGPDVWTREPETLADEILSVARAVTVSGGEPTDQPFALLALLRALRARGCDDIVMFSGRTLEALQGKGEAPAKWTTRAAWERVEAECLIDVLIDGPFMQERMDATHVRGSSNQRFIPITGRWSEADFIGRDVEVTLDEDGNLIVTGFPSSELRDMFQSMAG